VIDEDSQRRRSPLRDDSLGVVAYDAEF